MVAAKTIQTRLLITVLVNTFIVFGRSVTVESLDDALPRLRLSTKRPQRSLAFAVTESPGLVTAPPVVLGQGD